MMTENPPGTPAAKGQRRAGGVRLEMNARPAAPASATEQVLARASESFETKDARGRRIVLKKPQILAEYRLVEILGESAGNQTYVGMVTPAIWVTAVDDEPIPPPVTKREVEAIIALLDREGLKAVAAAIKEQYPAEFGAENEAEREAVKG